MNIPGLTIIGESINDSVPSTHVLFEKNDMAGIIELAKSQGKSGAAYIDVNVGVHSPGFMADVVRTSNNIFRCPFRLTLRIRKSPPPGWKRTIPGAPGDASRF